jgi:hypothetical protein
MRNSLSISSEPGRQHVESVDELICTLQIIRQAICTKDKGKASDSITIFLMQFMQAFGRTSEFVSDMLPVLKDLRDNIQSEDFEHAESITLALFAKLMLVKAIPQPKTIQ